MLTVPDKRGWQLPIPIAHPYQSVKLYPHPPPSCFQANSYDFMNPKSEEKIFLKNLRFWHSENAIGSTKSKTAIAVFTASNGQQWSPFCHKFLTVTPSYHSKVTPIGALHAKKIAEPVLL